MQSINTGGELLSLDEPVVMGVINVTPDSFYALSRKTSEGEILKTAEAMLQNGAAIIDIGGYSSRPGAIDIAEGEEIKRVIPAIKSIKTSFPAAFISIDTFRQTVAEKALEAGAGMINDITGRMSPAFLAKQQVPYVCMHMRGTPGNMQQMVNYNDLISEITTFLYNRVQTLQEHGVNDIIVDPGFGFAKTMEQNYALLNSLQAFALPGRPVLIGISRKSFIYKKLGISPEEALAPTLALYKNCIKKGVRIIRTHDVAETVVALKKKEE
ncbi:MAG: dihydropteroate synthase [Flavobacteriales bacterium]